MYVPVKYINYVLVNWKINIQSSTPSLKVISCARLDIRLRFNGITKEAKLYNWRQFKYKTRIVIITQRDDDKSPSVSKCVITRTGQIGEIQVEVWRALQWRVEQQRSPGDVFARVNDGTWKKVRCIVRFFVNILWRFFRSVSQCLRPRELPAKQDF